MIFYYSNQFVLEHLCCIEPKIEMKDWEEVYKTSNTIDAEMVKAMLEDQGIEAVVLNQIDSSFIFGKAAVYCKSTDAAIAMEFIKNNNQPTHE